ncbi:subtilisin-like protein [Colletotrichum zoysiae]|uniref:Subtilisin-like protein n=1 Tax=Colletotrichum zoysiae TaxID=1216348 RepID=A0AAD9LXR2_9PEZI|nr:subtilisin-like protein [Colletotrichum zoysiae]
MRVASSSIASPMPYIVLSRSDATQEAVQTIKSTLAKDAVSDSLTWMTSARTGLAVLFQANITSQQAGVIASLTGVAHVVPDSPVLETQPHPVALIQSSTADKLASLEIAARAPQKPCSIGLQRNAPDELKVISQPKGAKLADLPGFGYGAEAGKGVTIYTIDTGANTGNSEWTGMRGTHRFMYAPGAPHLESDTLNHGSCVASKAAGPMYGTAKNANLVMVKMSYQLRLSDFYATLVEVRNDIEAKRLRGKAVINMSVLLRIEDPSKQTDAVDGLRTLLLDLMADDVVVVTGSGNDRYEGVEDVTQFPATLGPTTNIIVVGGVDNDGSRAAFSQGTGNQLTVSAPAFVTCASGRGPGPQNSRGTSYAAPTVAGVIAVWLSQDMYNARLRVPGRVAANVKAMLKELAYPRILTGPPVVWNGVDPRKRSWLGSLCGAK